MLPKTPFLIQKTNLPELSKEPFVLKEEYQDIYFEEDVLSSLCEKVSFENCHFKNVVFDTCDFSSSSFVNVLFENCDLSNCILESSTIHRVTFLNSKLIGTSMCRSSIMDTVFTNCFLSYANFSSAKVKNSAFWQDNMEDAYFYDVKFHKVFLDSCIFRRAEFIHTPLKGIDFSTSSIEGIRTDFSSVIGMITSEKGALELSSLLQIQIRRDYENN